jgi:hypothetical protein
MKMNRDTRGSRLDGLLWLLLPLVVFLPLLDMLYCVLRSTTLQLTPFKGERGCRPDQGLPTNAQQKPSPSEHRQERHRRGFSKQHA